MSLLGMLHLGFGPNGSDGPAPVAPTLSVADLQNSSANVSISNSSIDSVNSIRSFRVGSKPAESNWIQQASIVGNGATVVPLVPGYYWFQAISSLNGQSTASDVVYSQVSQGSSSVLTQCLSAVQAGVQNLNLTNIPNSQIMVAKTPHDSHLSYPAIIITPYFNENIDGKAGTNLRDEIEYPVLVSILAADNRDQQANLSQYLLWRETIRKAFHNKRLTGVEQVLTAYVDPQEIVDQRAWFENNLYLSGLLIRFTSQEFR